MSALTREQPTHAAASSAGAQAHAGQGGAASPTGAAAPDGAHEPAGRLVYLDHFGLTCAPFQLTPNPHFFYGAADRGQMLYALWYCLRHAKGITLLTGESGCGKTQLARMLRPTAPQAVDIVYVVRRAVPRGELVAAIADQLGLGIRRAAPAEGLRLLARELARRQASDRRVVLVVDDAHELHDEVLHEIRALGAWEGAQRPLLQILLVGQEHLRARLSQAAQRELDDRITHRFHLAPLGEDEVAPYLAFRMQRAGASPESFDPAAARMIARGTMGLPRRIHVLADKSLMAACNDNFPRVMRSHVELAINETALQAARATPGATATPPVGHSLGRLWRRFGLGRVGPG